MLRGPFHRFDAHRRWDPDLRMRLLERLGPGIHVAILIMFALPAKRPRCCPGLDNEVVGLLKALSIIMRWCIVGHTFTPAAAHKSRHQAAIRNHVDHGQGLG